MSLLKGRRTDPSPTATNIKAYGAGGAGTIGTGHRGQHSLKGSDIRHLFVAFSDRKLFGQFPRVPLASLIAPQALMSVAVGDGIRRTNHPSLRCFSIDILLVRHTALAVLQAGRPTLQSIIIPFLHRCHGEKIIGYPLRVNTQKLIDPFRLCRAEY